MTNVPDVPSPTKPRIVALGAHNSRLVRLVWTGRRFQIEKQWEDAMGNPSWQTAEEDIGEIDADTELHAVLYALAFGKEEIEYLRVCEQRDVLLDAILNQSHFAAMGVATDMQRAIQKAEDTL